MPANTIATNLTSIDLISELRNLSHQPIELCYHCHKCTSGCPVVEDMEFGPDQVLRLIVLNSSEVLLKSHDIWLCAGCNLCYLHCPNSIDIATVMDALRYLSYKKGYRPGEQDVLLFHRIFLTLVRVLGQSHEAVMLGAFKILSHTPILADVKAGMMLFARGKVPLIPSRFPPAMKMKSILRRGR